MCAVEWKCLNEIASVTIGEFVHKDKQNPNAEYPVYNGGISNTGYYEDFNNTGNKIIISARGANAGYINRVFVNYWAGNSCYSISVTSNNVDWNFLFYFLKTNQQKLIGEQQKGGIPAISKKQICTFEIPIPSFTKQQEIVSQLDTFTTLISNLESELDMRRKQYEHYRNQLLDFEGVEKLPLSEVFEMRGGYTPSTKNDEFWEDGILPWFRMEDIRENGNILSDSTLHITPIAVKKNGLFPMNSIILATSATIGVHALLTVPALSNQRFTAFYPKEKYEDKVNYKYTYYVFYIIDEWCKNNIVQGGFASVDMAGLRKYLFPLPSLVKQQQIVEKLDSFEQLIQSLETEIKLRKQQYEYYREKLLTFEK